MPRYTVNLVITDFVGLMTKMSVQNAELLIRSNFPYNEVSARRGIGKTGSSQLFAFVTEQEASWVVYHLQGETGWSTGCANGRQNPPNGKFRSRLAIHSNLQRV